jgi:hypothetical protein
MSLSDPPQGHGSPPPPTAYPYGPEGGDPSRFPHPTLPPMSSLFRQEPAQEMHQSTPYVARQFQPPYNMTKQHPLWLSEMDPHAPVHHIYHPPQSRLNSQYPQNQADSILVPTTPQHTLAMPPQSNTPTQRQRQYKKIVQRQQDPSKVPEGSRSSSSSTSRHTEGIKSRSPTREPEPSVRRESSMSEQARRMSSQSQSQTSRSMPISGLLSDGPRYVRESRDCRNVN